MNFLRLFFVPADRLGVSTVILRSAIKFRAESWCVPFSPLCHCFSLTHFSDVAFLMSDHFKKERKPYMSERRLEDCPTSYTKNSSKRVDPIVLATAGMISFPFGSYFRSRKG